MLKLSFQKKFYFYLFLQKLNFLITGEKPTKKKLDYAKELKIKIIDQAEFLKMLNKTS